MEAGATTVPRYKRNRMTWLAFALLGYFAFLQAAPGSAVPYLRTELGIGYTAAALHITLFAGGAVWAGWFAAHLERLVGRRAMLWLGAAGMAGGAVLLGVGRHVVVTLLATLVMGAIGAWVIIGVQAVLADAHTAHRAVALSEANVAASVGALAVPLAIALGTLTALGWRLAIVVGLLGLAAIAVAGRRVAVPPPAAQDAAGAPTLPLRRVWKALLLVGLVVAAEWCVAFWGAAFLADEVGLPPALAVGSMSGFFGAMLAGRIAGSLLARRLPTRPLLAGALALTVAGFPLLWTAGSPVPAVAGVTIMGLGFGNLFPLSVAAGMELAPAHSTRFSGLAASSAALAVVLAPLALGRVADGIGLQGAFAAIPALLGLAAVALLVSDRARIRDLQPS